MIRIVALLIIAFHVGSAQAEPDLVQTLAPFLQSYCISCHGAQQQEGDRRFDLLFASEDVISRAEVLQEILDQLNLTAMPPEDEVQPSNSEIETVIATITRAIAKAREVARDNAGKVVMRRLNRQEYRNTVRDLFSLKMIDFDPTTTFPADDVTDGFDNVGEGLVTSDYLLRSYLDAARKVAEKVIRPGSRPEMIHLGSGLNSDNSGEGASLDSVILDKEGRKQVGRMFVKFRQPLGIPQLDKKRGVPADGEYVIRFSARAVRRKSRYTDEDLRYKSDEPMRLSISIDSRELGPSAHRVVAEYEIPDDQVIEIEHRLWLEKGFTFHLHWANGPDGSFKRILRKVLPKYHKDALYPIRNPPEMYVGSGPELHVETLGLDGPFYDRWPPEGFARFFPNPPENPDDSFLAESLLRLANVAYRRPVSQEELTPYIDLARVHYAKNGDFWEAVKYGVRAILTSPHFIYFAETAPENTNNRLVSHHELASRLSYFLWSSMPDDELRGLADRGILHDPAVLRKQVSRMLADPRSLAFVQNFTGQWLGLRQLGQMPPDPEKHQSYYQDKLEAAMRRETELVFEHILHNNRSVLEFVDSDYTFLNKALANHYGIARVAHEGFQKVSLKTKHQRGGVLGHGSILTATSNGVETQPIARGIWVLENLLGTPPNAPPPDIDPIEPDTRGVSTFRELMEKHRSHPTCYGCHRKIDPLGLALENYDNVGAWRTKYSSQRPIDPSGELPNGTPIAGPSGLKQFLLSQPEQFIRCLTEKLYIYALGRRLSFADRPSIDGIVSTMPHHNYGFHELIQQIVASEEFKTK